MIHQFAQLSLLFLLVQPAFCRDAEEGDAINAKVILGEGFKAALTAEAEVKKTLEAVLKIDDEIESLNQKIADAEQDLQELANTPLPPLQPQQAQQPGGGGGGSGGGSGGGGGAGSGAELAQAPEPATVDIQGFTSPMDIDRGAAPSRNGSFTPGENPERAEYRLSRPPQSPTADPSDKSFFPEDVAAGRLQGSKSTPQTTSNSGGASQPSAPATKPQNTSSPMMGGGGGGGPSSIGLSGEPPNAGYEPPENYTGLAKAQDAGSSAGGGGDSNTTASEGDGYGDNGTAATRRGIATTEGAVASVEMKGVGNVFDQLHQKLGELCDAKAPVIGACLAESTSQPEAPSEIDEEGPAAIENREPASDEPAETVSAPVKESTNDWSVKASAAASLLDALR